MNDLAKVWEKSEPIKDDDLSSVWEQSKPISSGVTGSFDKQGVGSYVKEMAGNYPSSLGHLVKNAARGVAGIVRHPVNTLDNLMFGVAKNVLGPVAGLASKKIGEPLPQESIPIYEQAKQKFLAGPYGSLGNYADYAKKDPAQAQSDIAMLLTGGGKLLEGAGGASKLGALEKIGSKAGRVGGMVEPLTAPMKLTGTAASAIMPSRFSQKLYASSAKMSTIIDPEVRQRLSQKLLDAEVKLNATGFGKLANDFESMWRGVDDLIDEYVSTGANKKSTVNDILSGINKWEERAKLTGRSKIVKRIKTQFIEDLTDTVEIGGSKYRVLRELDAKQVNRVKRDLYQELHSKYGKDLVPMASTIKMDIAHNAMEIIEELIPGVVPKNKTAAAYKELMDVIRNGVNRIENRDLLSIGVPVRAGATSIISEKLGLGEKAGGIAGLALGILDLPAVKSRVAIRLNRLRKQGVKISPTATAIKFGLAKYEDEQ